MTRRRAREQHQNLQVSGGLLDERASSRDQISEREFVSVILQRREPTVKRRRAPARVEQVRTKRPRRPLARGLFRLLVPKHGLPTREVVGANVLSHLPNDPMGNTVSRQVALKRFDEGCLLFAAAYARVICEACFDRLGEELHGFVCEDAIVTALDRLIQFVQGHNQAHVPQLSVPP